MGLLELLGFNRDEIDSKKKLNILFDNVSDIVIETDAKGIITYVNKSIFKICGYKSKELIGKNCKVLIYDKELADRHDKIIQDYLDKIQGNNILLTKIAEHPVDTIALHKNGDPINVRLTLDYYKDDNDLKFIAIMKDTTTITNNESKIKELYQFQNNLTEYFNHAILYIDYIGNIITANTIFANIIGMSVTEINGKNISELKDIFKIIKSVDSKYPNTDKNISSHIIYKEKNYLLQLSRISMNDKNHIDTSGTLISLIDVKESFNDANVEIKHLNDKINHIEKFTNIGLWEYDLLSKTIKWSECNFKLHFIPKKDDLTLNDFYSSIHPLDIKIIADFIDTSNFKYSTNTFDLRYRTINKLNDEYKHIHSHINVIKDVYGNIIKYYGISRDDTKYINMSKELYNVNKQQNSLINNDLFAVAICNQDNILWINDKFKKDFLIEDNHDILNIKLNDIFISQTELNDFKCRSVSNNKVSMKLQMKKTDNTLFWTVLYKSTIDPLESDSGYILVINNIDIEKQYEKDIMLNKSFSNIIINNLNTLIAVKDKDLNYIYTNRKYDQFFNTTLLELTNSEKILDVDEESILKRKTDLHIVKKLKNGIEEDRYLSVTLKYLSDVNNDEYIIIIADDITELKKLTDELNETIINLQLLYDIANDGLIILKDDKVIKVNDDFLKITGYTEAEVISNISTILPFKERSDNRDSIKDGIISFSRKNFIIKTKSNMTLKTTLNVKYNILTNYKILTINVKDVSTDRILSIVQMVTSTLTKNAIVVTDINGNIEYVNDIFINLTLANNMNQFLCKNIRDVIFIDSRHILDSEVFKSIRKGTPMECKISIIDEAAMPISLDAIINIIRYNIDNINNTTSIFYIYQFY
jgi:PAS domain S-box-containing protein